MPWISADGQLARLTGTKSYAGEWLDHFFDALKTATIHLAVAVCWARFYEVQQAWLLVPLAYSAVATTFFFAMILMDMMRRLLQKSASYTAPGADTRAYRLSPLYSLAVIPNDYGLFCVIFVLLWWQPAFMLVYTVLACINLLILLISAVRWYRELRRIDAGTGR